MAETIILTNNSLTRKRWAKDLFTSTLPEVEFGSLAGTDENSVIQIKTDLAKGEGDNLTFGILLPLQGEGVVGRDPIEGREEQLQFFDFSATIEELNHAVAVGAAMEQQRIPYDLWAKGKTALKDWYAQKLSTIAINYLCGNAAYVIDGKTFAQAATAPDTAHVMYAGNAATEATIGSADIMDLALLDAAKQAAETMHLNTGGNAMGYFKIRPIKKGKKGYYRVLLHTYCFDALKRNFNMGEWGDMKREAKDLAIPDVDVVYNDLLITKSERVYCSYPASTGGGVYRNVLLGAQAAVWPWGGAGDNKETVMKFYPYTSDAGRKQNFRAQSIFGMKKVKFGPTGATKDFGILTICAYGSPLKNG